LVRRVVKIMASIFLVYGFSFLCVVLIFLVIAGIIILLTEKATKSRLVIGQSLTN
jgi:hypothetical protein